MSSAQPHAFDWDSNPAKRRFLKARFEAPRAFQAWSARVRYKLNHLPASPPSLGNDSESTQVRYKITYRVPTIQSTSTKVQSVELHTFMDKLGAGSILISHSHSISIADLTSLHLEMPDAPQVRSFDHPPIFSTLSCLVYVGDPQHLEGGLGASWSISSPQLKFLKLEGLTGSSTFRKALAGCSELQVFSVIALAEDQPNADEGSGSPLAQITHTKLERLEVVSDVAIGEAFRGLSLEKLRGLRLWMMPKVAMGLRPEHLRIYPESNKGSPEFKLNFIVDRAFSKDTNIRISTI
ncbi:hypothetical protein BDN72DRAFT_966103 [Pluteus cervinus]|uniref:Uncharacterized protein n=1 Tax=Pluteus cervinus TaxID=181527 RepID=A0ACD3A0T7_9AGAR|nr:hypothetical protein BDN72DRAFT_966103 [Pluteus cervinus]